METGCFPDSLKEANITLIFKKDDLPDKSNYRPISILPLISKVYDRLIYNQLSVYTKCFLSQVIFHVVLERLTVHKMHFSNHSNLGKKS